MFGRRLRSPAGPRDRQPRGGRWREPPRWHCGRRGEYAPRGRIRRRAPHL